MSGSSHASTLEQIAWSWSMSRTSQGAVLNMSKMREILRLHELSYSQCEIARSCCVARSTVQDYLRRAAAKEIGRAHV